MWIEGWLLPGQVLAQAPEVPAGVPGDPHDEPHGDRRPRGHEAAQGSGDKEQEQLGLRVSIAFRSGQ